MRPVMTVIYFADGAVVGPLDSSYRTFDDQVWLKGIPEGEPAAGPLSPVLFAFSGGPTGQAPGGSPEHRGSSA